MSGQTNSRTRPRTCAPPVYRRLSARGASRFSISFSARQTYQRSSGGAPSAHAHLKAHGHTLAYCLYKKTHARGINSIKSLSLKALFHIPRLRPSPPPTTTSWPLILFSQTFSHPTTPQTGAPVISRDRGTDTQQQTQTTDPQLQKQWIRVHVKRQTFATGSKTWVELSRVEPSGFTASEMQQRRQHFRGWIILLDAATSGRDSIRTLAGIMGPRDTLDMQLADNKTWALTGNRSREQRSDQFRNEEWNDAKGRSCHKSSFLFLKSKTILHKSSFNCRRGN